jgi:hypothetical protein
VLPDSVIAQEVWERSSFLFEFSLKVISKRGPPILVASIAKYAAYLLMGAI